MSTPDLAGLIVPDDTPPEVVPDPAAEDGAEGGRKPSTATQLIELAGRHYRVVAAPDGAPYAVALDGPNLALPLRGAAGLRQRLAALYYAESGKAASASALADALAVLEGEAAEAEREPVALRLARHGESLVIDLGTADGRCVTVSPGGWTVADRSPVLFRRTALTGAMPTPVRGGSVDTLAALVNADVDTVHLIVGWLLAAFIPEIDHPILAIMGEQGTAKTTMLRMLVGLVDPSPAPTRTAPRDTGGWAVAASASWVVGLDNVSTVAEWFSDALCRAVTGDGMVSRALYTDADVSVLAFRRVIAMTSIDAGALRGDLGDRLLPVELHRIAPSERRSATDITARADAAAPMVLGALLDLLTGVLAALPTITTTELPRMADFARVLAGLDSVTGWATVADYAETASEIAESVVEGDPFAMAIVRLARREGAITCTATELLAALSTSWPGETLPRGWPKDARRAAGALKRIIPALRELGVDVEFTRDTDRARTRKVTISAAPADDSESDDGSSDRPSTSSEPSARPAELHERPDGTSDGVGAHADDVRTVRTVGDFASAQPSAAGSGADQHEQPPADDADDADGSMLPLSHVGIDAESAGTDSDVRYVPDAEMLAALGISAGERVVV